MKFIHIADIHLDSPFVNFSDKDYLADLRRLEQRKALKKVVDYIKENKIEFLFISGDLYEHKYIRQSTIEYINRLFKEIPLTKIFISPGNHDPFLKNSYYNKFKWNENVKIFNANVERVELEGVDIYGYGFNDFYCTNCEIENIEIKDKSKLNILVIHGTLDGASIEEKQYNSMSKRMLKEKGFDYIAMGHIHKLDYNEEENQKLIYPGSLIALGFDEIASHGMIEGEFKKGQVEKRFIKIDEEEFKEIEINIEECFAKEDLIEKINKIQIKENQYVKIILVGNRKFEIDTYEILKLIENDRIIKVKNKTKIEIDLEKLSNENTLKGLFLKEIKEEIEKGNIDSVQNEIIEKSIEIALEALG